MAHATGKQSNRSVVSPSTAREVIGNARRLSPGDDRVEVTDTVSSGIDSDTDLRLGYRLFGVEPTEAYRSSNAITGDIHVCVEREVHFQGLGDGYESIAIRAHPETQEIEHVVFCQSLAADTIRRLAEERGGEWESFPLPIHSAEESHDVENNDHSEECECEELHTDMVCWECYVGEYGKPEGLDSRPDDCDCGFWNQDLALSCFPCFREGYETPATVD